MVTVDVSPAATGQNDIVISVTDHGGQPLADEPDEVTATLRLPAQELGPIPVNLVPEGEGRYRAEDTEFPFAGEWDLNVVVRTSDFDQDQLETTVPIS
jgi:copper transport protein